MSFLNDIASAISSFFSSLKNEGGVATKKNSNAVHISAPLKFDAKKTWAIRKREFDKLRALRQNEIIDDGAPEQRFFHTNMLTDLSEKTSTLYKIDAIESQMSVQWVKTERLVDTPNISE